MKIEFQYFDDCPTRSVARSLLTAALRASGVNAQIDDIEVGDPETAERVRFGGSPTIRIDGTDIEPGFVDDGDYTLRCRVYSTSEGLKGVPEAGWITSAIDGARQASV